MGARKLNRSTVRVGMSRCHTQGKNGEDLWFVEVYGILGPGSRKTLVVTNALPEARAIRYIKQIEENLHLYTKPAPKKRARRRKTAWERVGSDKDHL